MHRLLAALASFVVSGSAMAGTTSVALYRLGNASGPRLDAVRSTKTGHDKDDVIVFEREGKLWAKAGRGGISTFSTPQNVPNEWVIEKGSSVPDALKVVNDHGQHWSWEPARDMPLDSYKAALREAAAHFKKKVPKGIPGNAKAPSTTTRQKPSGKP